MTLAPLGRLRRNARVDDWLESAAIKVPYFDGLKVKFMVECMRDEDRPEFSQAASNFLGLSSDARFSASEYLFKNYRDCAEAVGNEFVEVRIGDPRSVWEHLHPSKIHVVRRPYGDKLVYVQIVAKCDWEREHGLQLVYRRGMELNRVSAQDGHLTHCDAYDLPETEDRIS